MNSSKRGNLLIHVILIIVALTTVFPFYWMITTAVKPSDAIFQVPPQMFPKHFTWDYFPKVFELMPMALAYLNSMKIAVLVTVGTLLTSSIAAYAFAKIQFKGSSMLFGVFLATLMIPGQVTLIPLYILFSKIDWIDTHLPLMVPAIMINAYGVFMIKQFMGSIPNGYIESAKIDGASHPRIYWQIMMPLCKPAIITLGLFTFIGNWNNFFGPLIFLNSEKKFTVPLIISSFKGVYTVDWGLLMAASTVAIVPIIILYLLTQKYYVQGIAMSGMKG
ncbi:MULTISPECIES: carbohydrate ABC transporter permease [Paenibacillus]|uniref:Sugar ABC transporter permease n=1 Tax=Paenibacillus glycanilyticus TaxID=126569 RepID=A0ABQ6GML0_9BACL|nr:MULTISPECIES: carbohydrate ABC transporter permease [Paenibacillus]ACT01231.1 binding-protein-dependent transport systems inner membrane component [Paenibacillus sp. JDR-2]GLX71480.1 sugar ABC transporter permease [Paenibacillus glycanilyticus]